MNATDAPPLSVLTSGNYLAIFLLITFYVRKLTSPESKFPITLPPRWAPAVSALAGLAYGVLASVNVGATWQEAALAGAGSAVASGLLDGLLVAIFGSSAGAPGWARGLVLAVDDAARSSAAPPTPRSPMDTHPDAPASIRGGGLMMGLLIVALSCASCGGSQAVSDRDLAEELAGCQAAAHAAPDGGNLAAYRACKAEAGIP